ncbi:M16 family metallopeptidase [Flavihumibacter petaseus]|uniref:Peptidase M16 family protein n=1 Tax=Flavihumibacter petaseus NBRC 106054 TaxID=1220578 RepID=A0A0E9MXP7_9BACT|nr:pitrilysin family protein [Flavihumibacter petaseus]GAO42211.1 peptidase M16 family protein [Flavihumibacter petaseus NBRC 106054]
MINRKQAPPYKDAIEFDLRLKPYDKYVLKNGIEVYAVNAGAEEVIQIEWVFWGGNSYETKNLVAAATNFLLKNGTASHTAFEINEHFEYYGASFSRACYNETAVLNLHSLTKHLPSLLPMVRELLTDAIFPDAELQLFRQNSLQRLSVNLKKNDFVANRLIDEKLFGFDHPYGRYSRQEDFEKITRDDVVKFYDKYYRNGKCMLFVGGKLPHNIFELLETSFGDLPLHGNETEKPEHPVVPALEKKYRIANDPNGIQGAIRIARPFPNRHHPDFLGVQVLNNVFGGFFGSRLMNNIREDKGYTYGIYSYLQNHLQTSAWIISTEAGRDVSEATVQEVYHEMKRLRESLVEDTELLLVRNYLMGTILGDLDGPFHIIGRWKNLILNGLDERHFYQSIQIIKTIQPETLQHLAEKWLRPEDFYEMIVV